MRYLSGGESHGLCLTAIIEGVPAGLNLDAEYINTQLKRRQQGYGRGGRMQIESDRVEFISGLRFNETIGSPLTLQIKNRDAENWRETMAPEGEKPARVEPVTSPRPGHADYAGGVKYGRKDLRDVLERSSARETAIRVAVGSVARRILEKMDIHVFSHVVSIGGIGDETGKDNEGGQMRVTEPQVYAKIESSPLRCADAEKEKEMIGAIDRAKEEGDTLGGVFEIIVTGVPPGLGSHVQADRKLDGRLAGGLMSLQGIKGVEIGLGCRAAAERGSKVHDPFYYTDSGEVARSTNRAGGIEGGISNGEPLVVRAAMKPIPTLATPLPSVDLATGEKSDAAVERADVCAVPAASVVGEAIVAWELAVAFREKIAGDTLEEMKTFYRAYRDLMRH